MSGRGKVQVVTLKPAIIAGQSFPNFQFKESAIFIEARDLFTLSALKGMVNTLPNVKQTGE